MGKRKIMLFFCIAVLTIGSLVACGSPKGDGAGQKAFADTRTISVSEEEFQLIMKENQYRYERELRTELGIPDDVEIRGFFPSEEECEKALREKNMDTLSRIKIQQELAVERGLAEPFEWKRFQQQWEEENTLREKKLKETEVVYGVKSFEEAEFYMYQLDQTINLLKNAIYTEEKGNIGEQEILEYYQKQEGPMMLENEEYIYTMCDVTSLIQEKVTPDTETVLAALAEKLGDVVEEDTKFLEAGDQEFSLEFRTMNQEELRSLVRSDLNGEALLELEPGEVSEIIRLEGKYLLVKYEGFQKAGNLSEIEQEKIKENILEDWYETFIEEQAKRVVIKVYND